MNSQMSELYAPVLAVAPAELQALLVRAQAGGPALWVSLGLGGLAFGLVARRTLALRAHPLKG